MIIDLAASAVPSRIGCLAAFAMLPLLSIVLAPALAENTNDRCDSPAPNQLNCPLRLGVHAFTLRAATTQFLKLTNVTGAYLQIDRVEGNGAGKNRGFLEYGVYRNVFATKQVAAGIGEVAALSKNTGRYLSPIDWGGGNSGQGLALAPRDTVYIAFNPYAGEADFKVSVSASVVKRGVYSWRQPRADEVIECNGKAQWTRWSPWRNESGKPIFLRGALIYSESAKKTPDVIDRACIYILNRSKRRRYAYCDRVNRRSSPALVIPTQRLEPGELVSAQGGNVCPAGAKWDWVAFLLMATRAD